MIGIDAFDMLIDGRDGDVIQGGQHFLGQPDVFVVVSHLSGITTFGDDVLIFRVFSPEEFFGRVLPGMCFRTVSDGVRNGHL